MPRFFAELDGRGGAVVTGADVQHITHSLRRRVGDELAVRVGEQGLAGRITWLGPREITLEIVEEQPLYDRSQARVFLGMSLIDLKEMDLLVRCVTELGVAEIQPVVAERSNVRDIRDKRSERWRGIVLEAVKQCERRSIPVIREPLPMEAFLAMAASSWERRLVALQGSETPVRAAAAPEVGILIGPEGGFSQREQGLILSSGFQPVHLGGTILRAATAAMAAVGILSA